ncbi:MAG: SusC/RagA family TonB-linked outer membrane protein [Bacteroidales bacterium]
MLLILSLLTTGNVQSLYAQAELRKVSGTIVDESGEPVIGASILNEQTKSGTISDIDGNFQVQAREGNVLAISYIGMEQQKIRLKNQRKLDVVLKSSAVQLEEVVAIGYNTVKRKDLTGSVSSVKAEDLVKVPTSDVSQALAGRIAGVMVTRNDGEPGASMSIRVRGGISITQSNEPLYVIDGFPSEDGMGSLDPADIESIDVLKDASATAIYGSRGANGVIVITTKTGNKNGQNFSLAYDGYVGFSHLAKKLDVLSPMEFAYLDYERRSFSNEDVDNGNVKSYSDIYGNFSDIYSNYANREGVDWQDACMGGSRLTQNHRVSLSGNQDKMRYNMSYAFFDENGLMRGSGSQKHNIKLKIDHRPSDKWTVSGSVNFDHTNVYGMGTSGESLGFNKMGSILTYRPTVGMLGEDNMLLEGSDPLYEDDDKNAMQNPLKSALAEHRRKEYRVFTANGSIGYQIMKGLSFKNTTGLRYSSRRDEMFFGSESATAKRTSIQGSIRNSEAGTFQTSNILSYNGRLKKHRYTVMLGQEYISRWNRFFESSATNFPNDDIGLNDMSLGLPGIPRSSFNDDDQLLSFFGRVNYNYGDRFLFAASLRADGSTKFGPNNKFGWFPSVSGAWRLSEEEMIRDLDVFSDLKLRAGYGWSGNNRIPSYGSLALMGSTTYPSGGSIDNGYISTQIPNAGLRWEANKSLNIGLDMGFFNQRLTIAPEFYLNRSSYLLLNSKIPESSGFSTMLQNIGETQNSGVDIAINSVNIQTKNFSWQTSLNISHNKNKVLKLTGEDSFYEEARFGYEQNNYLVKVGKSLGLMYGFKTEGLYQVSDFDYDKATGKYTLKEGVPHNPNNKPQPGYWKFANVDDSDNVINDNDRTIIGDANPYLYGGMNNTFSYKGFDLSVFLNFSLGGDVLNATKLANTLSGRKAYTTLDIASLSNRWVTVGTDGKQITDPEMLQRINGGKTVAQWRDMEEGDKFIHSWGVEDASFLRISNISLGYTFSRKLLKKTPIKSMRLYVTANNLYTFTKYTGFDPEVSTTGSGMTRGLDWGAYPRSRSFVMGGSISF